MPKLVYISHEISGDVKGNIRKILGICKIVHTKYTIPFTPYLSLLQYLDDESIEERLLGMEANAEHFRRGNFDELWVYGTKVSKGVFEELELAVQFDIPVKVRDKRVEVETDYAFEGIRRGMALPRYLMAERKLPNRNTLFFRKDSTNDDVLLFESDTFLDPKTRKDVSRFVPTIVSWDEILDGWIALENKCKNYGKAKQRSFKERFYDQLAGLYGNHKSLVNAFSASLE